MHGHDRQNKRQYSAAQLTYAFDESKIKRAPDGKFGEKPGEQKGEERPSDKPKKEKKKSTEQKKEELAGLLKEAKAEDFSTNMSAEEIASEEKKISKELDSIEAGLKGETDEMLLEDLRGDKESLLERIGQLETIERINELGGGTPKKKELTRKFAGDLSKEIMRLGTGLDSNADDLIGSDIMKKGVEDFGTDAVANAIEVEAEVLEESESEAVTGEVQAAADELRKNDMNKNGFTDIADEDAALNFVQHLKNENIPHKFDESEGGTRVELIKKGEKKVDRQSSVAPKTFGHDKQNVRSYASGDLK